MPDSRIESEIRFHNYKVDSFTFTTVTRADLLSENVRNRAPKYDLQLGVAMPIFFEDSKYYVASISCKVEIKFGDSVGHIEPDARLEASVSGLFSGGDNIDESTRDRVVKVQFPALLLPYLRATISTFFSCSGIGHFIFPLVNIHKVAEQSLGDQAIRVVRGSY